MPLPAITETGDLPQGVQRASLEEVLSQFGEATIQRRLVGMRLRRVCELAVATRYVKRFIVFGSFVTAKPEPTTSMCFFLRTMPSTPIKLREKPKHLQLFGRELLDAFLKLFQLAHELAPVDQKKQILRLPASRFSAANV